MKSLAYGNPDAQELAVVSCRLWERGFKTRVFVAWGITGGPVWFSSFRPGYEVRDFSINPLTDILVRATWRLPRVG